MFSLQNINPYILIRDIIKGLWIAIMIGCIGTMVMYTHISDSYVAQYTSSAIYVVTPKQSMSYSSSNKLFAEKVITVFQNLMNTDVMKRKIAKELHQNKFDAQVLLEQIPETNLMKITVTANDPIDAFVIIGSIMENYNEFSEYLTSDAVFETIKAPEIPTSPDNSLTPRKKSLETGVMCGFVTIIFIALFSILRKTVKTENSLEELYDTNLLGTIYHEKKNRTIKAKIAKTVKCLLITSPIMTPKFIEAVNNIRIKLEYEHERHPEKNVYMFSSVCENEGKSTVSLNVALSLAKEGNKVIVIDADLRKPAIYKMLDIPKSSFVDYIKLLLGECGLDEVLYRDKKLGLDLIMASKGHSGTHELMKSGAMKDLIKKCSRMADYVIIDTPPMALVSDAEALVDRVDFSVLVVRQDMSYEKDIINSINTMNDASSKFLGCVLNNYHTLGKNTGRNEYSYGKAVEIYDK